MNLDNMLLATDTARIQAGGKSMFERLGDAMTAGVAGSVVSGYASIYNTGVHYSNNVFGTQADQIDTGKVLGKINSEWRTYYEENADVIDTVGFIGGAFVPGGLAVKGLNLARTGQGMGSFRSALGYTTRKQQEYLEAGLKQIGDKGADVFATINKNKLKSMAFGAADNVILAATFETAAALTMSQSSTLAGENWQDISWDIIKTSIFGGVLGGGIEALWTNKIFRDAGKLVDGKVRSYDTLVAADKLNLGFGDKAFAVMDAVMDLKTGVLDTDKALKFNYRLNGKDNAVDLDLSQLLDSKLKATSDRALLRFKATITNAVTEDSTVGAPLAMALMEIVGQGSKAGKSNGEIREQLGSYLFNLQSVQSLGASATDFSKDVVYLVPGASLRGARAENAMELFSPIRSSSKDLGYRVVGDATRGKYGILGVDGAPITAKQAWLDGFDMVLSGAEGKVKINPTSSIFRAITDNRDDFLRTTFNVHSKIVDDSPIVTIADMASKGAPAVTPSGVQAGKYTYQFSQEGFTPTLDSIQNSARHLWASQFKTLSHVTIDSRDFSMLDKLSTMSMAEIAGSGIRIKNLDGTVTPLEELGSNYKSWLLDRKIDEARKLLTDGAGELDTRQLSYALNVEAGWVENAVAKEFNASLMGPEKLSRQLDSYAARDNVVLVYKKPPIADAETPDFETGFLSYQHRKQLAVNQAETAAAAVLGKHGGRFMELRSDQPMQFDGTGAGPTAIGFSNSNYNDTARVWAQNTGRAVHLTQQDAREVALLPVQSHLARFVSDNDLELGAVLSRVRHSDVHLSLFEGRLVDLSSKEKLLDLRKKVLAGKLHPSVLDSHMFSKEVTISPKMYNFLTDYHKGHATWLNNQRVLAAAQGRTLNWSDEALYLPPIDTKQFKHFAFVKAREGRIFSGSDTSMITAKTPEELARLVAVVEKEHPDLQVFFKQDTEEYFKAKGDYEFSSGMNSQGLDASLRKQGKLGDFVPIMDAKAIAEDFVRHIGRREDNLIRSAVDVKYGQTFEELRWLSDQYTKVEKSVFGFPGKGEAKKVSDPFGDYRKLALNVSKQSEYTLWSDLNEFVDALGTRAYRAVEDLFKSARAGDTDWIKANEALERVGLGSAFKTQEEYLLRQTGADRSIVKLAASKGNMLLANVALRLDTANAMVNILSSPITLGMEVSAIRSSLRGDATAIQAFEKNLILSAPDGTAVPGATRMMAVAIKNFFGPEKRALTDRYQNTVGSIRTDLNQYHDMMESLALVPNMVPSKWAKKVDAATELGAKYTGNNFAEQFTRFVASDVMRQITQPVVDAGRMTMKEQNNFISIFVNRTQGNYISSQRPVMFQGVVGAALSLFQTYQFNMFQQLFRHIENKDGRTLAVAAGLQSSLFGLNGLPLFDAINTHLIGNANINEKHKDVYSIVASADKDWGDFGMFGALSAFPLFSDKAPALYTRGDLNPRHLTIIPTSFSDLPIVEAATRVGKMVWGMGNQVMNGAGLGDAMLHGMAHNGVSRPLAGMANVLMGRSTTSQGAIVSAHNDLGSIATATRLIGAKPMDESVAMNHKYRMNAYKAADKERLEKLGTVIKQKIAGGGLTEEEVEDFAGSYAAIGGKVQNYGEALQRWTRGALESEVNTIMKAHTSERSKRLFEVMGGDQLPDLRNSPPDAEQP